MNKQAETLKGKVHPWQALWAEAAPQRRKEDVLANPVENVLIYRTPPPMKHPSTIDSAADRRTR